MDDQTRLSTTRANAAIEGTGWRYILAALHASVPVGSYEDALRIATAAVTACGADAAGHLRIDLRPDRVELRLQTAAIADLTARDVALARAVTEKLATAGATTAGATTSEVPRPVQSLEIGIDALDIPAIRPFWKAVLAYGPDAVGDGPEGPLVDPAGQGPAIWFQQMDAPRPQRNRVHLDVTVAHDEAEARVRAALAAGGTLVNDKYARAWWVLADAEGNEVCVCTWQDRERETA